ncbi:MAG: MMPL family transporter [Ferroplasma sp.]
MFESFFYKIGKYVQKNKKKVLVFWIIAFILMAYPATLIFTDTSYNITNSLVTNNSQSSKANDILTAQFNSSSDPSIIIVSNNTSINNLSVEHQLMAFQLSMDNYLKSQNIGYKSTTSIFTVENKTLMGYSPGIYELENGTQLLIEYTINNLTEDKQNITQTANNLTKHFTPLLDELAVNSTKFVTNINTSLYSLITKSGKLNGTAVNSTAINMVYNATIKTMAENPLLEINQPYYKPYLQSLLNNSGRNYTAFVAGIINNNSYNHLPVIPSSYVSSSLISKNNSTAIFIFSYNTNLTSAQQSHVNSIENTYSTKIANSSYYLTSSSVSGSELESEILRGMVIALAIGIISSIIIVGLFFRSPLTAFLPFSIFIFSAVIAAGINGLLYKFVFHTTISFVTPTLLLILVLGIASDYSVFIISRYRSEIRKRNPDSIPESSKWAGHAVFTSGTTVAISYIVLWLSNVPIFSDAGLTNAIAAVVTIIVANTFLIAILANLKEKTFWPSKIKENQKLPFEKTMEKVAHAALHNKKKIIVILLVVSLGAMFLYSTTPTNMDVFGLLPASSGIQAIEAVNSSFHYDLFDPAYVMVNFTSPFFTTNNGITELNSTEYNQTLAIENSLMNSSDVHSVSGPGYPYEKALSYNNLTSISKAYRSQYMNQTLTYVGANHHYVEIVVYLSNVAWSNPSTSYVDKMPSIVNGHSDYKAYVGGTSEYLNNAYSSTSSSFDKMVPILGIAIFFILLIQIASVMTPIRLILMVMAVVILALSLTYLIFHYTLHLPIIIFLPLFVFITLLAVGLDYDIFMVTRIQENVMKGMPNTLAIRESIIETGGVIITLGALLFATFGALYFSGIGIIEEIGVGLALGVLIDTFVSWMFFVPAIMAVMDKYNWWPSKILLKEK